MSGSKKIYNTNKFMLWRDTSVILKSPFGGEGWILSVEFAKIYNRSRISGQFCNDSRKVLATSALLPKND